MNQPRKSWTLFILFYLNLRNIAGECFKDPTTEPEFIRNFYVGEHYLEFKIEVSNRITHQIVSHILKIILHEVVGYPYVRLIDNADNADDAIQTLKQISTCESAANCSQVGVYGPEVMINLEVMLGPGVNLAGWLSTGEVEICGPLGPIGRSGWYVADFVANYFWESNNTIIEHWKAFKIPEVAAQLDISDEDMQEVLALCPKCCTFAECDADGIYRPKPCQKPGSKCAVLFADYPAATFKLLKHEITNLNLLVKIVWVGKYLDEVILKRTTADVKTVFFHKTMFISNMTKFIHISFPNCENNEYECEFELSQLEKVVWSKIKTNAPQAFHVLKSISFSQEEYLQLYRRYTIGEQRGLSVEDIACNWVRENMYIWSKKWIPEDNRNKPTLYIGGIYPLSGVYAKQKSVLIAANMAKNYINNSTDILPNVNLEILIEDGQCTADESMNSFIKYITNSTYKNMIGILGPACTDTVEPIAAVAKYFKVMMISYSASGTLPKNFEYFFRTVPETTRFKDVYMKILKTLGYSRISAITEEGKKFPEYISALQEEMQNTGLNFIAHKKFKSEIGFPELHASLQDLKDRDARIIIGDFHENAFKAVMCHAWALGMTSSNGYLWFLPMWIASRSEISSKIHSKEYEEFSKVNCTVDQMTDVMDGYMSLSYNTFADDDSIMQENKTVKEWFQNYRSSAQFHGLHASPYGGYAYDAVWAYAKALDGLLRENNSHIATIHTNKTCKKFAKFIRDSNFTGVSGPLSFINSSRLSNVIVWQWVKHNNTSQVIAVYYPTTETSGKLVLEQHAIFWPSGKKIDDGSKRYENCQLEFLSRFFKVNCDAAAVVANILGCLIFFFLLLVSGLTYKWRYDKKISETEARMKELGLIGNSGLLALDEWEIPRDQIVINRKLGEGAFGTVFGGEAHVQNLGWVAVAVKILKNGAKSEEKIDFLSEAKVMKHFDHQNIVKLVGVCTREEPVYTIMEFMLYGDLKTYLLSRRNFASHKDRNRYDEVSDKRLTSMSLDIARGLSYLAEQKYVHRDLACRNCLLNLSRSVKIADFGMCRAMYDSDYYKFFKKGMLPIRWMAPESVINGRFTPMSDVWSYGVILYEIVTFGSSPYQGLSNNQVVDHIKTFKTLSVPKGLSPEMNSLFMKCWEKEPHSRIRAAEIVELLAENPGVVSPCIDMPMARVDLLDSTTSELSIVKKERGYSFSNVFPNREISQEQKVATDNSTISNERIKHCNKKITLRGSFRNQHKDVRKIKTDAGSQTTHL